MNNTLVWNNFFYQSPPPLLFCSIIQFRKSIVFDIDDEQSFIEGRKFANDICQILQKEFANLEGWRGNCHTWLKAVDFQSKNCSNSVLKCSGNGFTICTVSLQFSFVIHNANFDTAQLNWTFGDTFLCVCVVNAKAKCISFLYKMQLTKEVIEPLTISWL